MLALQNLKKQYEDRIILNIPNFELKQGINWLQGENGSGKTTLLKILAGLVPYSGDILLTGLGAEKKNRSGYRRWVNYAEAEPNFPLFLSGNDLIGFYEKAKGPSVYANELMSKLGVKDFSSFALNTYSSGMLKKLSLVLGFIGSPKVLLLDEPLITLDVKSVSILIDFIKNLASENPAPLILFTSHQTPDLEKIPIDKVYKMESQTIEESLLG